MQLRVTLGVLAMTWLGTACAHRESEPVRTPPTPEETRRAVNDARQRYDALLERFAENDQSGTWSAKECAAVGRGFVSLSERHRKYTNRRLETALYNAGLAFQRCGDHAQAKRQFTEALRASREFHQARTELVLYEHRESGNTPADVDRSIGQLEDIVRASKFQDLHALVTLSALLLERGRRTGNETDLTAAKLNLQRALAVDDAYVPAINQLALYHLEDARRRLGVKRAGLVLNGEAALKLSRRQLDLAVLTVRRGLLRAPADAPLHNTLGLLYTELENYTAASQAFSEARSLDPKLFAAHMNYAALNLMFRGYSAAEHAYRDALGLASNSYEAHLGLALALRGQLGHDNSERLLPEIDAQLALAEKLAPGQPEASFNQAVLAHAVRAETPDEAEAIEQLESAATALRRFLKKAGDDPEYRAGVVKAKQRLADIQATLVFLRHGQQLKKGKRSSPQARVLPSAE